MNSLDHHLLRDQTEKTAFDQTLRNFGVDVLGYGGAALKNFEKNPMVSSAVLGAGIGGVEGALTAPANGETRTRRGLRHALYGGAGAGVAGGLFGGAARNIGRYGKDITDHVESIRGKAGLQDAAQGAFHDVMKNTVLNPDSYRGGKALKTLRDRHDAAEASAALNSTKATVKAVRDARKALNDAGGGLGTRFNPLQTAALLGGGTAVGVVGKEMHEKNSSLRLRSVLDSMDKQANFGALAAKAVGFGAQGAGKAIQMGAANPALAGAAVGAAGGAITGGEGNRLKGALGGAALGAGAGAGLAKLAPQATANMGQFGKSLTASGKGVVGKAGKDAATFSSSMKPFDALSSTRAQFAKENITHSIKDKGKTLIGNGMSGSAAAGTALAGVGAAGLAGGAAASGMFGNDR